MARDTHSVGILGAGTMGAGIAQVASQHGWIVQLMDVDDATVHQAIDSIRARFDRLVEKGRMTADDADAAKHRLHIAKAHANLASCELLIEAIVEDLDVKTQVLGNLLVDLPDDAIIATNTSSLSITQLSESLGEDAKPRVVGMHFFNPAPLMKLVEVIAGEHTDPLVADRVAQIAALWGKVVARANDVPGFIVNHVARPYYLEAFRIVEDGLATPDVIDAAMKSVGFRMGPFELTDLIGQDVNTATTRSVWVQLGKPPLLAPSALQESLVEQGHLGRKTQRGVYDYSGDEPVLAIKRSQVDVPLDTALTETAGAFARAAGAQHASAVEAVVIARIIAALIVQANLAVARSVASQRDIDTALKFGVNYPKGPFEWAQEIGDECVTAFLDAMNDCTDDQSFAIAAPNRAGT